MTEDEFEATEVRNVLDKMDSEDLDHTKNVHGAIESFAKNLVESGTTWPDCEVTAEIALTLRERMRGRRTQDVTAMLCIGVVLGSALERDVPANTALEDAWRDGEFELPDIAEEP